MTCDLEVDVNGEEIFLVDKVSLLSQFTTITKRTSLNCN